ncbi:unnamed protein product [Rotaria sp. Silwood2]|nr:unnamed protein product [Rotaria sp. Silwood2]
MDVEIYETTESTIPSLSNDTLVKVEHCWNFNDSCYQEKNEINEDDDSSSSEDENDGHVSDHHRETPIFQNLDCCDVPDFISSMEEGSMNRYDREKARQNKEKFQAIRRDLVEKNLILRPSYQGNGFHLYTINEFQQKVSHFMTQTDIYSFIKKLTYPNGDASQQYLATIVDQVETTLDNLFHSQQISKVQHWRMRINRSFVRMNYLYFVADIREVGVRFSFLIIYIVFDHIDTQDDKPIRPIMVCNDGPTMGIARYLGHLLGLLFNEATHCKLFSKSVDVIHTLEHYRQDGHLQPTTLFASFNINDLCTKFSHSHAINALERFLHSYVSDHQVQHMTIGTILQLVRLVLDNQYFVYDNKLYRQIAGGASGSPLTIPLVYIYLFYWQQDLMNVFLDKDELFLRYQNEAFITWNKSEQELLTSLDLTKLTFPQPIWNVTGIGTEINFRDIELGHHHGILHTKVNYLNSYIEDNTLRRQLHIIQHPIDDVWTWLRAALLKAARHCSDEVAFEDVQFQIQFIFSLHGYSNGIFNEGLHEFLEQFGAHTVDIPFTRSSFEILRQHVFNYDKYRRATKKQRERQRKEQIALYLPYTNHWDKDAIVSFEQELNNLLRKHLSDHLPVKDFWIKILARRSPPLPIKDLLIKKRPPMHLLTLSETEKNKKYTLDQDIHIG